VIKPASDTTGAEGCSSERSTQGGIAPPGVLNVIHRPVKRDRLTPFVLHPIRASSSFHGLDPVGKHIAELAARSPSSSGAWRLGGNFPSVIPERR